MWNRRVVTLLLSLLCAVGLVACESESREQFTSNCTDYGAKIEVESQNDREIHHCRINGESLGTSTYGPEGKVTTIWDRDAISRLESARDRAVTELLQSSSPPVSEARRILDERFAKGEITEVEYKRMRELLEQP